MLTVGPLGVSILFPVLTLGVKKLTLESGRPQGFSIFYAAMVVGLIFAGPMVDFIRHDYKMTSVTYHHTNKETGEEEERQQYFSCWRIICLVSFMINIFLIILLAFYDSEVEKRFIEEVINWGKSF